MTAISSCFKYYDTVFKKFSIFQWLYNSKNAARIALEIISNFCLLGVRSIPPSVTYFHCYRTSSFNCYRLLSDQEFRSRANSKPSYGTYLSKTCLKTWIKLNIENIFLRILICIFTEVRFIFGKILYFISK